MKWASTDSERITASPGVSACCPGCRQPVLAKCGEIRVWHWAHRGGDCDPWYESETAWHLNWKKLFPDTWQEVVMGPHRADIKTPRVVIELQHSSISVAEIREREAFYGDMIWIFDLRSGAERFRFLPAHRFADGYIRRPVIPDNAVAWVRARRTVLACTKPVFVHLGRGRLYNIFGFGLYPSLNFEGGFYRQFTEDEFMTAVGARAGGEPPRMCPVGEVPYEKLRAERKAYFWNERDRGPIRFRIEFPQKPSPREPIVLHRFSDEAIHQRRVSNSNTQLGAGKSTTDSTDVG